MPNLLLEQYARYKKPALNSSPYSCLLNTNIELNPHQINAFCAAIQALRTGGIILADEQRKHLRDQVYECMCERAKNSNVEYIKYVKKDLQNEEEND